MSAHPVEVAAARRDHRSRCPIDLQVADLYGRRVLIVGAALAEATSHFVHRVLAGATPEYVASDFCSPLAARTADDLARYDFQLVLPPLRPLMSEAVVRLRLDDGGGHRRLLDEALARLEAMLDIALTYAREGGITTILGGLLVPQQNPNGRLLPRFDPRNPVHVVERFNERIAMRADPARGIHYLDLDAIAATIGKRHVLDDSVWVIGHGAFACDWDHPWDASRKAVPAPLSHSVDLKSIEFRDTVWREADAIWRASRCIDPVAAVVLDLDDTLWRGAAGEGTVRTDVEGWPLGLIEALLLLKRRGIRLALCAHNDPRLIEWMWPYVFGPRLSLADFSTVEIGRFPRTEGMRRIFETLGVAPSHVVLVDDDAAERDSLAAAFPGLRTLGADPYFVRSALLWAPETQAGAPADGASATTSPGEAAPVCETAAAPAQASRYVSVFSLGGYCQVTHQLKTHGIAYTHSPFDWLVTPFASIEPIIENRGAGFGLGVTPSRDGAAGLCDTYAVMHAHDLPWDVERKAVITVETRAGLRSKFQHKCGVFFSAVAGPGRKLFIRLGGDASPPLAWPYVRDRRPTRHSELVALAEALARAGAGDFDLAFITYEGLTEVIADRPLPDNVLPIRLKVPHTLTWQGCEAMWGDLFAALPAELPHHPSRHVEARAPDLLLDHDRPSLVPQPDARLEPCGLGLSAVA